MTGKHRIKLTIVVASLCLVVGVVLGDWLAVVCAALALSVALENL
jgi:uncharacterized protein YneF (UPF0154 family)